jgi:hypothetical protein
MCNTNTRQDRKLWEATVHGHVKLAILSARPQWQWNCVLNTYTFKVRFAKSCNCDAVNIGQKNYIWKNHAIFFIPSEYQVQTFKHPSQCAFCIEIAGFSTLRNKSTCPYTLLPNDGSTSPTESKELHSFRMADQMGDDEEINFNVNYRRTWILNSE